MRAFLDTNVLIRHLTADPPDQAAAAAAFLEGSNELRLPDLIIAEVVHVLESFYRMGRGQVGYLVRAIIDFPAVVVADAPLLRRTLEVYEIYKIDFANAYLVASAENSGGGAIASFDRAIDRVPGIRRIEPRTSESSL